MVRAKVVTFLLGHSVEILVTGKNVHLKNFEKLNTFQTRWLYCVECPQYSRGAHCEALGYLCDYVRGVSKDNKWSK